VDALFEQFVSRAAKDMARKVDRDVLKCTLLADYSLIPGSFLDQCDLTYMSYIEIIDAYMDYLILHSEQF
jgi:hypothetical protein